MARAESYREMTYTCIPAIWVAITLAASTHSQDIYLSCNPVDNDLGSIRQRDLPIRIRFGDKPAMTLWDGTRPDWVVVLDVEITFGWNTRRANTQRHEGALDRRSGWFSMWVYDHFVTARCLPLQRVRWLQPDPAYRIDA
jgi:hypothetical protein